MGRKKGYVVSEETKKKIGQSHKGKKHSEETKEKIRKSRFGLFQSVETKEKIANSLLVYFKKKKPLSDDMICLYKEETGWIEKHRFIIDNFDDVKTQSRMRSINHTEIAASHFIEEIVIDDLDPETLLLIKEEMLLM